MMTLQARESFSPINYPGRPLRAYPVDSPRAKARLVVLALLADGRMDAAELDGLAKNRAFAELGVTREAFFEVLYDFCADATGLPDGRGSYLLSPALLETLFAEVGSVAERQKLVRRALLDDLLIYYRLHVEGFGELRSPAVLHALLA